MIKAFKILYIKCPLLQISLFPSLPAVIHNHLNKTLRQSKAAVTKPQF